MSPLELVDDRFAKLAGELRAARPIVSEGLRERVRALAPPPARRLELNVRRLVPAAGLVALAGALGVAGVLGILHGSSAPHPSLSSKATTVRVPAPSVHLGAALPQGGAALEHTGAFGRYALVPSNVRLQQYDANLTVRVSNRDELSQKTQDALRFIRRLGGYVVWARYSAPGERGDSELALRIPVDHVQAAIKRFSGYGALVRQRIVLKDLQRRVDDLTARIGRLRAEMATIEQQLAGVLTPERRAALEHRLQQDRLRVAALGSQKNASVRRAGLARVALTIVARPKPAAAAGRFERTIDKAGSVLVRELEVLLYALVVAGPLLLLGLAAIVAGRGYRRRSDRRLLERI